MDVYVGECSDSASNSDIYSNSAIMTVTNRQTNTETDRRSHKLDVSQARRQTAKW